MVTSGVKIPLVQVALQLHQAQLCLQVLHKAVYGLTQIKAIFQYIQEQDG
jgi:hypothetical protein